MFKSKHTAPVHTGHEESQHVTLPVVSDAHLSPKEKLDQAVAQLKRDGSMPGNVAIRVSEVPDSSPNTLIFYNGRKYGWTIQIDPRESDVMDLPEMKAVLLHEVGHIKNARRMVVETTVSDALIDSAPVTAGFYAYFHRSTIFSSLMPHYNAIAEKLSNLLTIHSKNEFDLVALAVSVILIAPIMNVIHDLNHLRISIREELASDTYAIRHGGHNGVRSFLLRAATQRDEEAYKRPLFKTHPSIARRLENVEKQC